jgi:hypothetical protein
LRGRDLGGGISETGENFRAGLGLFGVKQNAPPGEGAICSESLSIKVDILSTAGIATFSIPALAKTRRIREHSL